MVTKKSGESSVPADQPAAKNPNSLAVINERFRPPHWIAKLGASAVLAWFLYEVALVPLFAAEIYGLSSGSFQTSIFAAFAATGVLSTIWNWRLLDRFFGFLHRSYEELMENLSARANARLQARNEPVEVRKQILALTRQMKNRAEARATLKRIEALNPDVLRVLEALRELRISEHEAKQQLGLDTTEAGIPDALEELKALEQALHEVNAGVNGEDPEEVEIHIELPRGD